MQRYRPTRDTDFLAKGDNSPEAIVAMFKEICSLEVSGDGVRFDPATVKAVPIIEDADYEGIRVTFVGNLENARIPIQVDLGIASRRHAGRAGRDQPPRNRIILPILVETMTGPALL